MRTIATIFAGTVMIAGHSMPASAQSVIHNGRWVNAPTMQSGYGGGRWGGMIGGRWWAGSRAPGGWNGYQRLGSGAWLPQYWAAPNFVISDYASWGLRAPRAGHHWVRYYDDAVLVDARGRVADCVTGIHWNGARATAYAGGGAAVAASAGGGGGYGGQGYGASYSPPVAPDYAPPEQYQIPVAPDYPPPPRAEYQAPPPPQPQPQPQADCNCAGYGSGYATSSYSSGGSGYYANGYYIPTVTTVMVVPTVTTTTTTTTTTETIEDTTYSAPAPRTRVVYRSVPARPHVRYRSKEHPRRVTVWPTKEHRR